MKPNHYLMQGFVSPLFDGSNKSEQGQSLQRRKQLEQRRRHIRRYDDGASVVQGYQETAVRQLKSQRQMRRFADVQGVNTQPSAAQRNTAGRQAANAHNAPQSPNRGHTFTEPTSRYRS